MWPKLETVKIGGWMIVDDTDLVTGTVLADFMRADPKWQAVTRHRSGRFAIYKKLRHPIHDGRWWNQPYLNDTYPIASVDAAQAPPGFRVGASAPPIRSIGHYLRRSQ